MSCVIFGKMHISESHAGASPEKSAELEKNESHPEPEVRHCQSDLLKAVGLARSTLYYQLSLQKAKDKYADVNSS